MNNMYPCKECDLRKAFAIHLDLHFYGEDCPFVCEKYDKYISSITKVEGDD